jgi:hypothetical protein
MGQGISVAALGNDTLYTGYMTGPGDRLQSCSAVIFCNTATGAAGLFHFPAGSINDDPDSAAVIRDMAGVVRPNLAWILFGRSPFLAHAPQHQAQQAAAQGEQLRAFVLGLLPVGCRLRRMPATTGNAAITWEDGQPRVAAVNDTAATDLRAVAAGQYQTYRLYGRDRN